MQVQLGPWLNRQMAAAYSGLAVHTLENYASLGIGPKYVIGLDRRARYKVEDIDAWIAEGTVKGGQHE